MSVTYNNRQDEMNMLRVVFPELNEDSRACRVISRALGTRLTPKQRQALVMHYCGGLTISEIARLRGVYPSTVARTLDRARKELMWAVRLGGVSVED